MVGELSRALPEEGGYYAWVRRALGPFWGFQEAWLSLAASIFDMAIYPTLFVLYLGAPLARGSPSAARHGVLVVAGGGRCHLRGANVAGVRVVATTSLWLFCSLSAPFAVDRGRSPFKAGALAGRATAPPVPPSDLAGRRARSRCGTTWAGTTPPRSRARSSARSAPIPARCSWPWRRRPHLRGARRRHVRRRRRSVGLGDRLVGRRARGFGGPPLASRSSPAG